MSGKEIRKQDGASSSRDHFQNLDSGVIVAEGDTSLGTAVARIVGIFQERMNDIKGGNPGYPLDGPGLGAARYAWRKALTEATNIVLAELEPFITQGQVGEDAAAIPISSADVPTQQ